MVTADGSYGLLLLQYPREVGFEVCLDEVPIYLVDRQGMLQRFFRLGEMEHSASTRQLDDIMKCGSQQWHWQSGLPLSILLERVMKPKNMAMRRPPVPFVKNSLCYS
jgi:hypothetical protein